MNEMRREPSEVELPLTREQEALWMEWKLSPTGVSYNTCVQTKLRGAIDVERFAQAASDVAGTFQLLRAYCQEDGGKVSLRLSNARYLIDVIDVSDGASAETADTRRKAYATLTRRRDAAIDLTRFPLIRAALVKSGERDFYFIGVVPHIISDGFSALFVLQAISIVYDKGMGGLDELVGDERKDWMDYLAWRAAQDPERRQAAVGHWQETLAGANHHIPICQHEGSVADTHGKRRYLELGSEVTQQWMRLTRSKRTSLFSALAALYAAFLYRQTDCDDVIIAHPVNQRPPGFRYAFGFYVNVVPLRIDLSGQPSFSELVERIGKTRRRDRKHHHLPALDIVQAKRQIQPDFDGRLTNVSMGETVSRFQGMSMQGIESEGIDNDVIDVRDDLSLMYEVAEDRIGLWLEYRHSAFDEAVIDQLAGRLERLASAIQADPDQSLATIDVLSSQERSQIIQAGDGGPPRYPQHPDQLSVFGTHTIAEAFHRSARLHRDAIALRYRRAPLPGDTKVTESRPPDCTLSYGELSAAVNRFATQIEVTNSNIAVCLPRSPEQIIALLAILATGNSYVPLDPQIPPSRAQTILADCAADSLVTSESLAAGFSDWRGKTLILSLSDGSAFTEETERSEGPTVKGTDLAYVIYTSGSTGVPKGVRVNHAAVMQRLAFLQAEYDLTADDRMLANTSFTFDVSVAELFWPLLAGAGLVLARDEESRDPRALRQVIAQQQVTSTCIVPSALTGLLTVVSEESLSSLRLALVAGEALPTSLAAEFHAHCEARLANLYGPTEGTIYASACDVDPVAGEVTIGRPLPATRLYVVNQALQLQPPGVEGELCIGGEALAQDYLGREDLNSTFFVANPFGEGRLYRTGDRVCLRSDGMLEYRGRSDSQIKLRGFRVELGEIEHALREHAAVTDAGVIVDSESGRQQVIAFYAGTPVSGTTLRGFLEARLPRYMVPNRFERLEQGVPRLPSGKLNRGQLPALDGTASAGLVAPANAREKLIAECWARVLDVKVENIGVESNFFELGGDSLLLISLACELEAHGLFIEVHELFDNPTIRASLPLLREEQEYLSNQSPIVGTYPALARHRKLFDDGFAHPGHWNRCILVKFQRLLDKDALQAAADAVSSHHDGLRISFHESDDGVSFRFHAPGAMDSTLVYLDLSALPEESRHGRQTALLNELNAGFDLGKPPLLRIAMIDDDRATTVALVVHHLLIDMRSCQVLLEDLLSAYQAAISHRSVRLPRKTSSLAEWTQALHARIDEDWKSEELDYWIQELAGVPNCRPEWTPVAEAYAAIDADQRSQVLAVSKETTQRLVRGVGPQLGVGMQDLVLTAFASAFKTWSKLDELVVNTCGVGRDKIFEDINLTRTVGELNTVYPLRLALQTQDMLSTVAGKLRAVPERGLHYGMLRYIAGHAALRSAPEPEVFFNYVSRIDTSLGDALGATISMAPSDICTSHPENRACYRLYAEASVYHGALELDLGYDSRRFTTDSVNALLGLWKDELEMLARRRTPLA